MKIQNGKYGKCIMVTSFSRKNILITGGAGFIGSHLVEELYKKDTRIFVIDIAIQPQSIFSLNSLGKKSNFRNLDVTEKENLFTFIKQEKIEYIFHLAAQTLVTNAYKDPENTLKVNIDGTINILEAGRNFKSIKGIVIASSDKAYGKTKNTYREDSPLKGDHPYDVSKSCADLIAQAYIKTYNLPVTISRFGNVYGAGDYHWDRIVPGICKAIAKNETFQIRSDGKYIRDYLYVKDVVEGYITLLERIEETTGNAYNFSSSDTLSVLELIEKIEKILSIKIPYTILNIAKNEIPYQHLNDSKIRKLGWRPKYNLENTLPPVFKWYKNNA